jgi:hypothetical protein
MEVPASCAQSHGPGSAGNGPSQSEMAPERTSWEAGRRNDPGVGLCRIRLSPPSPDLTPWTVTSRCPTDAATQGADGPGGAAYPTGGPPTSGNRGRRRDPVRVPDSSRARGRCCVRVPDSGEWETAPGGQLEGRGPRPTGRPGPAGRSPISANPAGTGAPQPVAVGAGSLGAVPVRGQLGDGHGDGHGGRGTGCPRTQDPCHHWPRKWAAGSCGPRHRPRPT